MLAFLEKKRHRKFTKHESIYFIFNSQSNKFYCRRKSSYLYYQLCVFLLGVISEEKNRTRRRRLLPHARGL